VVAALELERVVLVAQAAEGKDLHARTISNDAAVLADVVHLLRCPVCEGDLALSDGALRCDAGHSFDVARQGYVNLLPGSADTAAMVEARDEFLRTGQFDRLTRALVLQAGGFDAPGAVVDLGAGTGHYLSRTLDALPRNVGIAIDSSPAALRRAARSHERAAAVGADVWKPLPLKDDVAALVLSVFAPRNPAEIARILAPGGYLVAATPTTRHLYELVGPLGLLSVPDDKEDRLDAQLASRFELVSRDAIEYALFLSRDEAAQLVRMGPSAWHVDDQAVSEGIERLPDPLTATASVTLSRYRGAA
jgi:23S rRNA (guanine745-N1)-methyltransferase